MKGLPVVLALCTTTACAQELPLSRPGMPYTSPPPWMIHPPAPPGADGTSLYRISGSKPLRPARVSDDGMRTYIEWTADQAIPATFALGPTGEEQTVDGYMRGGVYTIDRVYPVLIFRIDKQHARAIRIDKAKPRSMSGSHGHG